MRLSRSRNELYNTDVRYMWTSDLDLGIRWTTEVLTTIVPWYFIISPEETDFFTYMQGYLEEIAAPVAFSGCSSASSSGSLAVDIADLKIAPLPETRSISRSSFAIWCPGLLEEREFTPMPLFWTPSHFALLRCTPSMKWECVIPSVFRHRESFKSERFGPNRSRRQQPVSATVVCEKTDMPVRLPPLLTCFSRRSSISALRRLSLWTREHLRYNLVTYRPNLVPLSIQNWPMVVYENRRFSNRGCHNFSENGKI